MEEQDWKYIEEYYLARLNGERKQKERAQQLVKELTEKINQKNAETTKLKSLLALAATSLEIAVERLKELEKAK